MGLSKNVVTPWDLPEPIPLDRSCSTNFGFAPFFTRLERARLHRVRLETSDKMPKPFGMYSPTPVKHAFPRMYIYGIHTNANEETDSSEDSQGKCAGDSLLHVLTTDVYSAQI